MLQKQEYDVHMNWLIEKAMSFKDSKTPYLCKSDVSNILKSTAVIGNYLNSLEKECILLKITKEHYLNKYLELKNKQETIIK